MDLFASLNPFLGVSGPILSGAAAADDSREAVVPDDKENEMNKTLREASSSLGLSDPTVAELLKSKSRRLLQQGLLLFGLDLYLSPYQEAAVIAVHIGLDVAVNLPTGGGKSLIYLLPALAAFMMVAEPVRLGFTLVVCPIVALVQDQAAHAPAGTAEFIDGNTLYSERKRILRRIASQDSTLLFLYVTIAMLVQSSELRLVLSLALIARVVLDEYHTLIEWDFMEATKYLCDVILQLPGRPPVALLSATASVQITAEVEGRLQCSFLRVFSPLIRPHICLSVIVLAVDECRALCIAMSKWINAHHNGQCGIIYTTTPDDAERIHKWMCTLGHHSIFYHGQMGDRAEAIRLFQSGNVKIVVATQAFGMGYNDRRIRWIIRDGVPGSTSEWIQQSGRAGRDGNVADAVCFFNAGRVHRAYRVFAKTETSRGKYDKGILHMLDVSSCRQKNLGLWPEPVLKAAGIKNDTDTKIGVGRCCLRCDARSCSPRSSQPTWHVNLHTLGLEALVVLRKMRSRSMACTFAEVLREWEHVSVVEAPPGRSLATALTAVIAKGYMYNDTERMDLREGESRVIALLSELAVFRPSVCLPMPEIKL